MWTRHTHNVRCDKILNKFQIVPLIWFVKIRLKSNSNQISSKCLISTVFAALNERLMNDSAKFKFKDWDDENETTGLINLAVVYLLVNVIYRALL